MGITIVIITHEMSVVESTCTHVAIIDDGRLAECGTVESVFSQPEICGGKEADFPHNGRGQRRDGRADDPHRV